MTREQHGCVVRVFDWAKEDVNQSVQEAKTSMGATVAATCALSCGTRDMAGSEGERNYLESALKILSEMTEMPEELCEVMTVEKCDGKSG